MAALRASLGFEEARLLCGFSTLNRDVGEHQRFKQTVVFRWEVRFLGVPKRNGFRFDVFDRHEPAGGPLLNVTCYTPIEKLKHSQVKENYC